MQKIPASQSAVPSRSEAGLQTTHTTIIALQHKAQKIKQTELKRAANKLTRLDPRQRRIVTELADGIASRLIEDVQAGLKRVACRPDREDIQSLVDDLFGLGIGLSTRAAPTPDIAH